MRCFYVPNSEVDLIEDLWEWLMEKRGDAEHMI